MRIKEKPESDIYRDIELIKANIKEEYSGDAPSAAKTTVASSTPGTPKSKRHKLSVMSTNNLVRKQSF